MFVPLFVMIAGCIPSPVGRWTGVIEFEDDQGDDYVNELIVGEDAIDVTLYSLAPSVDEDGDDILLIYEAKFDGTWQRADDLTFGLRCIADGCSYSPAMDCSYVDDWLACDLLPDYYADDEEVVQWIPSF
jgi:hypothetical protein